MPIKCALSNVALTDFLLCSSRSPSPELWRANRTAQLIENEFGGSPSALSRTVEFRGSVEVGKHTEERILMRAAKDARKDALDIDPHRSVSILMVACVAISAYCELILCKLIILL